jgi:hypothetical protein
MTRYFYDCLLHTWSAHFTGEKKYYFNGLRRGDGNSAGMKRHLERKGG